MKGWVKRPQLLKCIPGMHNLKLEGLNKAVACPFWKFAKHRYRSCGTWGLIYADVRTDIRTCFLAEISDISPNFQSCISFCKHKVVRALQEHGFIPCRLKSSLFREWMIDYWTQVTCSSCFFPLHRPIIFMSFRDALWLLKNMWSILLVWHH